MKKNFLKKSLSVGLAGAMVFGMATNVMAASDEYTVYLDRGRIECELECYDTSANATTDVYSNYQADVIWASVSVQFEGMVSGGGYEYIDSDSDYSKDFFSFSQSASAEALGDISYSIEKNASSSHSGGIDSDSNGCALSVDY